MAWTKKWPIKPGKYWFYGWRFGRDSLGLKQEDKPELSYVEVLKISNGFLYVTRGHSLEKSEGAEGQWCKAELPELPELE